MWTVLLAVLLAAGTLVAQDAPGEPDPPVTDPPVVESSGDSDPDPESGDQGSSIEGSETTGDREEVVPAEGEDASSDRIRYSDPLDIDEEPFGSKWDRFLVGLTGITRYSFWDGQLRFRLGVRFQADGTLVSPSDQLELDLGPMDDTADFRRARVFAEGILKNMYFRTEVDFAADSGFKSAYLEGREGGVAIWGHLLGKFRYGLFQEPFSLENNMSSFDTTFVEVSMPVVAIGPGSNLGGMVYDASPNRQFLWAVGAFSWGQSTEDNASTSLLSLSGRFGFQPVRRNEGETVLHVGASVSSRSPTNDEVSFSARPEARFVRPFVDTGDIPSNNSNLFGIEMAWKNGDWWAQGEWIRAHVDSGPDTLRFGGWVVQVGHFLTGKSRPWDSLVGVWGRVRPDQRYRGGNPFKASNGGEWELAARYSALDLTDGMVEGGIVRNITAGVNWYPADTWKLQFNWVHSRVEDSGYANIWILRYQFFVR
jgi:phosphate-selective porin OprO/OprP